MKRFYSPGKILISGEYVVLDGAVAFAIPTRYGQAMEIYPKHEPGISWQSRDHQNEVWFEDSLSFEEIVSQEHPTEPPSNEIRERLLGILRQAHRQNPKILSQEGFRVVTKVDFPRSWGLGTSSTLIHNMASWFEIDPFILLENTFGGSGYDIAVAQKRHPITFERTGNGPKTLSFEFNPNFRNHLFFVHLNRKQNSRESITQYRRLSIAALGEAIEKISSITHQMIACTSLAEFELLMQIHENIIANLLNQKKVKQDLFPEYPGAIKSLGGWGGDFILATGNQESISYFEKKGFRTVIPYDDMVRRF